VYILIAWWRPRSKPRTAGRNAQKAGRNEKQHIGSGFGSGSPLEM